MGLTIGTRIGVFEVTGSLGVGGMGEVYRARDTTLHRDVALKILPDGFAEEPERLARFRQEAQVLASLNHPNIGAIHGLEEVQATDSTASPTQALVLELVEGPTLADRIAKGPIPVDESLTIARQITEALEAAHAVGIVHRDLKPANIKLRPDGGRDLVKVLDFGLAKPVGPVHTLSPSQLTATPTITTPAHLRQGYGGQAQTVQGVILGTAAYMSPEQATGKPVDAQTDIWAFGCVLFEMLSGQRLFGGDSVTESLGAVLHKAPEWEALPTDTPPRVRVVLERCLARDPRERLHDMADVRFALDGAFETVGADSDTSAADTRRLGAIGAAAMLVGATLAGVVIWALKPVPSVDAGILTRTVIATAPEFPIESNRAGFTPFFSRLAISPDGERIVYASGERDAELGDYRLVVRDLDSFEVRELPGTEGGLGPEFSPDGTSIAFHHWGDGALKRVSVLGGTPTTLVTLEDGQFVFGISWAQDDTITFSTGGGGDFAIHRVPADGGVAEQLLPRGIFPMVLPNGRGVIFFQNPDDRRSDIKVLSLDTGETTTLWSFSSRAGIANVQYSPTGHLLYGNDGTLWARPFDQGTLTVAGDAVPLLEGVRSVSETDFAISAVGSLVYGTAPPPEQLDNVKTLVWVDRNGEETPLPFEPLNYGWPALSSDGRRLAVSLHPLQDGQGVRPLAETWIFDLARGSRSLLATEAQTPVWSPDDSRIFYAALTRLADPEMMSRASDGSGDAEPVSEAHYPLDVRADGTLLVGVQERTDRAAVAITSLQDGSALRPLLDGETEAGDYAGAAQVSPDGRWVAFAADLSGQPEVYAQRFPDGGGRVLVSVEGGEGPRWSRDGTELFYLREDGPNRATMMRVAVSGRDTDPFGPPEELFTGSYQTAFFSYGAAYDVSPDASRFLMLKRDPQRERPTEQIVYVQNWPELLRRVEAGE